MKKYYSFTSSDKVNKINVIAWLPKQQPRAIMQISHGMTEHMERYDAFARYLNMYGILVVGNDHLGHGKSVKSLEDLGYFGKGDYSVYIMRDLHIVAQNTKKMYGEDLPYILVGHSMGSFVARRYAMHYKDELTALILMGTGNYNTFILHMGKCVINTVAFLKGERYSSALGNKMFFGLYNRRIEPKRTEKDWLSTDENVVNAFLEDPYCNYDFTVNGLRVLLNTLLYIHSKKNLKNMPKDLPVLLMSGKEDPVGEYTKTVRYLYNIYIKLGLQDVEIKLYDGCRHELIHEKNKLEVYEKIRNWIEEKIKNG